MKYTTQNQERFNALITKLKDRETVDVKTKQAQRRWESIIQNLFMDAQILRK